MEEKIRWCLGPYKTQDIYARADGALVAVFADLPVSLTVLADIESMARAAGFKGRIDVSVFKQENGGKIALAFFL